ncbi:hypothetical protein NMY22_g8665 [Coprinellus aureogranulatus]|nr:hypothetical protein NMY22_g8665 [Coprinellus aureogranulatus]
MSEAATPTVSTPRHLEAESDWVYPTGAFYGDYPYTYSYTGGSYHYNPHSTSPAALGSTRDDTGSGRATRGVNYFFGFLITFITLLLLFVLCGVGSKRRAAARRRRDRMEEDTLRRGMPGYGPGVTFRGLLAGSARDSAGRDAVREQELMKQKPTYHEVWLAYGDESRLECGDVKQKTKSAEFDQPQRKGSEAWLTLEPLSATVIRTPKDLQPYQHFYDVNLASGSINIRNDTRLTTGASPLLTAEATDRDTLPPLRSCRYPESLVQPHPTSMDIHEFDVKRAGATGSMIAFPHPDIEMRSIDPREKLHRGDLLVPASDEASLHGGRESHTRQQVEVAVVVVMPSEVHRQEYGGSQNTGSVSSLGGHVPYPSVKLELLQCIWLRSQEMWSGNDGSGRDELDICIGLYLDSYIVTCRSYLMLLRILAWTV